MLLIEGGNKNTVSLLLCVDTLDILDRDRVNLNRALFLAIKLGDLEIMKLILQHRANV